jgi:hypothetical protein
VISKEWLMVKRKALGRASPAKVAPAKGRLSKAEEAKAARKAKQPDLLDLLTEKPKATRTRAKKEVPGSKTEPD